MANNQQQASYFDERRHRYADPNFYNRSDIVADISRNAKRIIRDIRFGNISEEDYIYFTQTNIINTLIQIAENGYKSSVTELNALNFYINYGIRNRMVPVWVDINEEISLAANSQITLNNRVNIWGTLMNLFYNVRNGADPHILNGCLNLFDTSYILNL